MAAILALDAAWTSTQPSGVALIQKQSDSSNWRCVAVAPSYEDFFGLVDNQPIDWFASRIEGTVPNVPRLLKTASTLVHDSIDLVTVDMPMSTEPILARRVADDAVSREFGNRWCSAHTPNINRPGELGACMSRAFFNCGYQLATVATLNAQTNHLVEVYPHPALLSLLRKDRRVPYKVSKSRKYWPQFNVRQRIEALLDEFYTIHFAISQKFDGLDLNLPASHDIPTLSKLKRFEDALDALVCAWVGVEYLERRTVALGDEAAAIWCPNDVVHGLKYR